MQLRTVASLFLCAVTLLSALQLWSQVPIFGQPSQTRWDFFSAGNPSVDQLFYAGLQYEMAASRLLAPASDADTAGTLLTAAAAKTSNVKELERAATLLRRAASNAPHSSTTWARLAYVDFVSGYWNSSSESALLASEVTGRLELDEMKLRIWLGLRTWTRLSDPARLSIVNQIKALWSRGGFGHRALSEIYTTLPEGARLKLEELTPDPQKSTPFYRTG